MPSVVALTWAASVAPGLCLPAPRSTSRCSDAGTSGPPLPRSPHAHTRRAFRSRSAPPLVRDARRHRPTLRGCAAHGRPGTGLRRRPACGRGIAGRARAGADPRPRGVGAAYSRRHGEQVAAGGTRPRAARGLGSHAQRRCSMKRRSLPGCPSSGRSRDDRYAARIISIARHRERHQQLRADARRERPQRHRRRACRSAAAAAARNPTRRTISTASTPPRSSVVLLQHFAGLDLGADIERRGIRDLTAADIEYAA